MVTNSSLNLVLTKFSDKVGDEIGDKIVTIFGDEFGANKAGSCRLLVQTYFRITLKNHSIQIFELKQMLSDIVYWYFKFQTIFTLSSQYGGEVMTD